MAGCDSNAEELDEREIRDIIYDIARDFSWNDIDGIMARVHPDYLHNGLNREELRELWLGRRATYELLDCTVDRVEFEYDRAVVFLSLDFTSSTGNLSYQDPATSGDISHFIRSGGEWLIWGNQAR